MTPDPYNHRMDSARRAESEARLSKTLAAWGVKPPASAVAAGEVLRGVLAEFRPDLGRLARETAVFVCALELAAILAGLRLLGPGAGRLPAGHLAGLIRRLTPWRRPSAKGHL